MSIKFTDKVAIVTGAGNGLGRSHALALAARGAKVLVNDFGGARDGSGGSSQAAQQVVEEIIAAGGEAMASGANVADFNEVHAMVAQVMERWGRVDILINNAGILRDKAFTNIEMADFQAVMDVHVMGAVHCTKAVWEIMRQQQYGRIVMTTSSSGLYGNFGQSNYGAAKMALLGLMNTLVIEGAKYNIRVNALAPTAATRMTEDVLPPELFERLSPSAVSAGALVLCQQDAPNRLILCAGMGGYSVARIVETPGTYLPEHEQTPEAVQKVLAAISAPDGQQELSQGAKQGEKFLHMAMAAVDGESR